MWIPKRAIVVKRDINKLIDEYKTLKAAKKGNFGAFYPSEVYEIREKAEKKGPYIGDILFDAIANSLKIGFMVGYKAAQREARNKRHGKYS